MNKDDLNRLNNLQHELEYWDRCNKHFQTLPKNAGMLIKGIDIRFNEGLYIRELDSVKRMNPIYRQIILQKITEAVKETFEEVKKEYESAQITF